MKTSGTNFQKKVWNEIKKIPKGRTKSYKELAIAIGHPKAARAVANACGKNPNPIITPCHRVIASDGSIGGYSGEGGVNKKRALLADEGVYL
jgi:methylated-DNA-[protein]-cysteine S-methyltransferase